eukprot:TRINITY_DN23721_c0_g1_i1.p1 TRINITY_DN23721_c0_g1~~TRINITY_DN23721_c0_g1_i1.p1  ORF type:complete len:1509 (+),score=227.96 TRINITY_DN23721_c0_g1_i1:186-4712(+)
MDAFQNAKGLHLKRRAGPCTSRLVVCGYTLLLLPVVRGSSCPEGLGPGDWYGTPEVAWQANDLPCPTDQDNRFDILDTPRACKPFAPGEAPTCRHHQFEGGGWWCPLTTPKCEVNASHDCPERPLNETWVCNKCLEDSSNRCVDEYGVCKCAQCPCEEGRAGPSCELCPETDGTTTNNVSDAGAGMTPRPGMNYFCKPSSYDGWYPVYHTGFVAEPVTYASIFNDTMEVTYYFSTCTLREKKMFESKMTDCSLKAGRIACKDVPSPCWVCSDTTATVNDGSFLGNWPLSILFVTSISGEARFGCEAPNYCTLSVNGLIVKFPYFECVGGPRCGESISDAPAAVVVEPENNRRFLLFILPPCAMLVAIFLAASWFYRFSPRRDGQKVATGGDMRGGALGTLSWCGLSYSDRVVGLSGAASQGSFTAILGPIGSGKTTLLNLLAGRLTPDKGLVSFDGKPVQPQKLHTVMGLVPQEDCLCPDDTVREAIDFAALTARATPPDVSLLADKLDSRISTLSGGQRRLASVYVELARKPQVLLLDEPTTNLDSDTASKLVALLQEVSKSIPVVATLHQPGEDICCKLTNIMILAEGKLKCMVSGNPPTSDSEAAGPGVLKVLLEQLQAAGRPVPEGVNPLDAAIDAVTEGKQLGDSAFSEATQLATSSPEGEVSKSLPQVYQLLLVQIRSVKRGLRRPFYSRYAVTGLMSLLLGIVFLQVDNGISGVRNRLGALFLCHAYIGLQGVGAATHRAATSAMEEHEIVAGVYSRPVLALSRLVALAVEQMPHGALLLIVYFMAGFQAIDDKPAVFSLCMMACAVASAYVSAPFRSPGPPASLICLLLLLSGFLISNRSVRSSVVLEALQACSPFLYSFEVTTAQELVGLDTVWQPDGTSESDALTIGGDAWLNNFYLPSQLDDAWVARGYALGWCVLGWMVFGLLGLLIPWHLGVAVFKQKLARVAEAERQDINVALLPEGSVREDVEMSWSVTNQDVEDVKGSVRTGQLHALVGPIGSGKTTLLCALAGRVAGKDICIKINGKDVGYKELQGLVGLVPQKDSLCVDDTVDDAIAFAAAMSGHGPLQVPALDAWKGRKIATLSGGQRRLVSIYVELARRPNVLLLDEPTSSLDSNMALRVVKLMKDIATTIPVVVSLHHPRPEICDLLTHLTLLHKGRLRVCAPYSDFLQNSNVTKSTFSSALDHALRSPEAVEPLLTSVLPGEERERQHGTVPKVTRGRKFTPILTRECRRAWGKAALLRIVLAGVLGLIVGFGFQRFPLRNEGLLNRLGFFMVVNVLIGVVALPQIFVKQRTKAMASHELRSRVLRPELFHLAQTIADLPIRVLSAALMGVVLFAIVPIHEESSHGIAFVLILLLTSVCTSFFADAIAVLAPVSVAHSVYTSILIVLLVFGGPFYDASTDVGEILQYVSFFRAAYTLQIVNAFSGQVFAFDPVLSDGSSQTFTSITGEEWLRQLHYDGDAAPRIACIAVWAFLFYVVAAIGLRRTTLPRGRAAGAL